MARKTLRDILEVHLTRYREDLEHVRKVYPPELWQIQWDDKTQRRVEWMLEDIVQHFRAYAAEQQAALVSSAKGTLFEHGREALAGGAASGTLVVGAGSKRGERRG